MSGKFSRDKGARFERELAKELQFYGYNTFRTAQYCGTTGYAPDVSGLPGIHIEAKAQERMQLYDWYAQSCRDASKTGEIPVVIHKKNYHKILVTMGLEDFMKLYREWEAGYESNN